MVEEGEKNLQRELRNGLLVVAEQHVVIAGAMNQLRFRLCLCLHECTSAFVLNRAQCKRIKCVTYGMPQPIGS